MAILLHEIWEEEGSTGPLPGLCLAGPDGDPFRKALGPTARLVTTFEAGSNFEAMVIYYERNGWGEYKLHAKEDKVPYPDSWLARQRGI